VIDSVWHHGDLFWISLVDVDQVLSGRLARGDEGGGVFEPARHELAVVVVAQRAVFTSHADRPEVVHGDDAGAGELAGEPADGRHVDQVERVPADHASQCVTVAENVTHRGGDLANAVPGRAGSGSLVCGQDFATRGENFQIDTGVVLEDVELFGNVGADSGTCAIPDGGAVACANHRGR